MNAARCRCSHAKSQHYRSRSGSPMCVGSCGCLAYAPPVEPQEPGGVTPATARAAALVICGQAADRAEATELLAMCGLIDTTERTTP